MVTVANPDIGNPATSAVVSDASPATERIKKFFEDKDWKFYAAVFAGVAVAGAGAYYLTSGSSSKKSKKSSSSKKKEAEEATGKGKASTSAATGKSAFATRLMIVAVTCQLTLSLFIVFVIIGKAEKVTEASSVDDWVKMTPEAIASLPEAVSSCL
jgi:hypothetical protein